MKKIKKNKKKVNSYRDAKDATSAHEKILADPTLPGTIGNFRSKRIFFRDALHLAHPARSSIFTVKKKERKTSLRDGTTRCKIHPGWNFRPLHISISKKYSYEGKVRYKKSAQDSPESRTMCALPAPGQFANVFGQINYAGPGVPFAPAHLSTANPAPPVRGNIILD